jgi:Peptidase family C25
MVFARFSLTIIAACLALIMALALFSGCGDDDDDSGGDNHLNDDIDDDVNDDTDDDVNDDMDDDTDDDFDDDIDDDIDDDVDDDDTIDYSECDGAPCPIVDFWAMNPGVLQVPLTSITETPQESLEFLRVRVDGVKVPVRVMDPDATQPVVFANAPPIIGDGYTAETHVIADLTDGDASPMMETLAVPTRRATPASEIIQRHTLRFRDYWAIYHPPAIEGVFPDCWASERVSLDETLSAIFEGFSANDRAVKAGFELFGGGLFARDVDVVLNGSDITQASFNEWDTLLWEDELTPAAPDGAGAFEMIFSLVDNGFVADSFNVVSAFLDVRAPLAFEGAAKIFISYETEAVDVKLPGEYAGSFEVWDVTDPLIPKIVELVDDGTDLWLPNFTPGHAYAIFDPELPPQPDGIFGVPDVAGVLEEEGDLIILAPEVFHDELADLLTLRENEGWTPVLRSPRELYHLFNNGYASPDAILDYLDHAAQNWTTFTPRALFLIGDSTPHLHDPDEFDIRLNLPTMYQWSEMNWLWFPSDTLFSFVPVPIASRADIPLAVGRLPARTEAQVAAAVERIADYQAATTNRYVYISDDNESLFKSQASLAQTALPAGYASESLHLSDYNETYPPVGGENQWEEPAVIELRADLLGFIQAGASVVEYYGHGDMNRAAGEIIIGQTEEVNNVEEMLIHNGQPPVFILFNCLSGYFAYTSTPHSLAESMVILDDGDLGAAGVISPAAYGFPQHTEDLSIALQDYFTNGEVDTVGEALVSAAKDLTDSEEDESYRILTMSYNLMGDPCLPLADPTE